MKMKQAEKYLLFYGLFKGDELLRELSNNKTIYLMMSSENSASGFPSAELSCTVSVPAKSILFTPL